MTQVADLIKSATKTVTTLVTGVHWMDEVRAAGTRQFEAVGYPNRKSEEWRFTNVDPIAKTSFKPAPVVDSASVGAMVAKASFNASAVVELVFVNGHFAPGLSNTGSIPAGVRVLPMVDALSQDIPAVKLHLSKQALVESNPFVALNTGHLQDGAVLLFPRNATVHGVIHLLFVTAASADAIVTHPRVLVVAEDNVEATFVESYVGDRGSTYFTNAVTEIIAGMNCRLDHCKLQQEGAGAFHVGTLSASLARGAQLVTHSATLGAKLTRNDVNVSLNGEGADATLNGLVLLDGTRHCDNHTLLDHAAAHCPSHELYKHVLDDSSTGVFKGKILVRPDSQKTDSKQSSKTLLLSDDALMNSMPALEIYADDVKCTHGSTTGPMDEEQVFYLRSRGVESETARHLLTYAFAADITRRIRVEPVRARIENYMAARHGLPLDLRITDLGSHDEAVVNA